MTAGPPWFKPTGVLDPNKHERLISNRVNFAREAGIPVELIWKALPALSEGEKDWLARFQRHRSAGFCGLLLTGESPTIDPLSRVGAMAGFLIRHFVHARVFSLLDALSAVASNDDIVATCLLIPDFVSDKKLDKALPAWRVQQLTSLLADRWSESKLQTVLYAPSLDAIGKEYGSYVRDLIKNHYINVEVA